MNVASASYFIKTFNGDISKVADINNLSATLRQATQSLNDIAAQLISVKNSTVLPTIFGNSFKNGTSVNPITTPPYKLTGQVYWSSSLNTLISSNGQNTFVWIGSTWIQIDSNNNIMNTTQNISVFLLQKLGQIPTGAVATSLNINSSGSITTSVSITNVTVSSGKVTLSVHTGPITNIAWNTSKNTLVGLDTKSNKSVAFSISPDSKGSYWSDVTLK